MLHRFEHFLRNCTRFAAGNAEVVERLAVDRQPVPVPFHVIDVEVLAQDQGLDEAGEAARVAVIEERLLDVERDPAAILNKVERLGEHAHGNIAEAKRRHRDEAVEAPALQILALSIGLAPLATAESIRISLSN